MNYNTMSPYQLGETKSVDAIEYLISFLIVGKPNEKRLAASGISKLRRYYKKDCQKAVPYLILNLNMPYPQVRQYTLKALSLLSLNSTEKNQISFAYKKEDKQYNILLFEKILGTLTYNKLDDKDGKEQIEQIDLHTETLLHLAEQKENSRKKEIADNDLVTIKTGLLRLIDVNSADGFPFRNSNLTSFLKGQKWKTIEKYLDRFPGYKSLEHLNRVIIDSVFVLMIDKEIEVFFKRTDQYAKLTDLGREFLNSVASSEKDELEENDQVFHTIDINKTSLNFRKPEYVYDPRLLSNFSYEKYLNQKKYFGFIGALAYLKILHELILELMEDNKLDKRYVSVYIKRINGGFYDLKTLEKVGQEFKVTRERIRQIILKVDKQLTGKSISFFIINSHYKELIETFIGEGNTIDTEKFISFVDELSDYFSIDKAILIGFSIFNVRNKANLIKWIKSDFYTQKRTYKRNAGEEIIPQTFIGKALLFDADLHVYLLSFHDLWNKPI